MVKRVICEKKTSSETKVNTKKKSLLQGVGEQPGYIHVICRPPEQQGWVLVGDSAVAQRLVHVTSHRHKCSGKSYCYVITLFLDGLQRFFLPEWHRNHECVGDSLCRCWPAAIVEFSAACLECRSGIVYTCGHIAVRVGVELILEFTSVYSVFCLC